MTISNLFKGALAISVVSLSMMTFSAQASECKGLDNESCTAKDVCGWVEAYTRKDDREVNAFCRKSTKGRVKISGEKDQVNQKKS